MDHRVLVLLKLAALRDRVLASTATASQRLADEAADLDQPLAMDLLRNLAAPESEG